MLRIFGGLMSAIRIKILSLLVVCAFALALPRTTALAEGELGLGTELGAMLGQTAGAITGLNDQRALIENQKQLLHALNSQEAQLIQANITAAGQELANVISRELPPCLQRNSIAASSLNAASSNPSPVVLGQTSCKDPKVDLSVFDEELTCGNAQRAGKSAEGEK